MRGSADLLRFILRGTFGILVATFTPPRVQLPGGQQTARAPKVDGQMGCINTPPHAALHLSLYYNVALLIHRSTESVAAYLPPKSLRPKFIH